MKTSKLKMSLEDIRNSINIDKKEWINVYDTNCYAYALGLDIPQYRICDYAYNPGVIGNSKVNLITSSDIFSYNDLIHNMILDFEALGIDYREVDCLDRISDNEWKIALFISKTYGGLDDFHFLRQHNDDIWYHKSGIWNVTSYDDYNRLITNPKDCFLEHRTYNKCFSLKLKK